MRIKIELYRYFNSPDTCSTLESKSCTRCNCDLHGSVSTDCDGAGKCTCKENYYGKKCNNKDCEMGEWTEWSKCPCGVAGVRRSRSRSSKSFPTGYGIRCPSDNMQYTICSKIPCKCTAGYYGDLCQDRDCTLTSWTKWSKCPACPPTCEGYNCPTPIAKRQYRSRKRQVKIKKAGIGKCEGEKRQTANCGYCKKDCHFPYYKIFPEGRLVISEELLHVPLVECNYIRVH